MILEASVGIILLSAVSIFYAKNRSVKRSEPEEEIFVTTSKEVPGLHVKEVVGYIESSSIMPSEGEYPVELAEEATVQKLIEKARNMRANAILELP